MIKLHPPSNFLLAGVAQDIEPSDAEELRAANGTDDIQLILEDSRDASFECYVVCWDDRPLAVVGLAFNPDEEAFGTPWAIMTREMRKHPRDLMRLSRSFVARWRQLFPFLSNYVDQRNTRAIRWLKALGFEMKHKALTATGVPFYYFEMRNV